jgi:hypothetical protein
MMGFGPGDASLIEDIANSSEIILHLCDRTDIRGKGISKMTAKNPLLQEGFSKISLNIH